MVDLDKNQPPAHLVKMHAFLEILSRFSGGLTATFRKLAEDAGIPYLECEGDGKRGPRVVTYHHNGTICNSSPGPILPGEANNGPSCFLNVPQALERLGKEPLIGMYFHVQSLNLVLVTKDDKIGIRSNCLRSGFIQLLEELYSRKPSDQLEEIKG